jgi:hypothetical protein
MARALRVRPTEAEAPGGADAPEGRDDADVPAAVFCMICGRSDCAGCTAPERPSLARTPWEEAKLPVWRRLWQTARLATMDGEAFFGGLGDGSVSAALGFALSCELLAIASLAAAWLPIVYVLVPGFVEAMFADEEHRGFAIAAVGCSVPVLAVVMVVLHVLWAGGLELGLTVTGAPPRPSHCLRYALYSCGWDLVTSPVGFAAGWASSGFSGAAAEFRAAVRIPRLATLAYVGRARHVPDPQARRALLVAAVLTGAIVLVGALALGVGLVIVMT